MIRYLLELLTVHTLLIGIYWLFLKNENQFSKIRYYLLASTFMALFIPLLDLPSPFAFFENQREIAGTIVLDPVSYLVPTSNDDSPSSHETLYWIYGLISLAFLFQVFWGIIQIFQLKRSSHLTLIGGIPVHIIEKTKGSFSFFNWIFLEQNIAAGGDPTPIVLHEQAHVKLRHSYDLVFILLFRALFWWLPTSWYVLKEIKKIHEYQADALAIKSCNADEYSKILISSTLKTHGLGLASSFHDGLILKRLKTMKQNVKKISPWKLGPVMILGIVIGLVFACNSEQEQQAKTDAITDEVFTIVEEQPSYPGGMNEFYKYVAENMSYPSAAREKGVQGRVYIQFVVDKDGSLTDVQAVKGIGSLCDAEAVRVIRESPKWIPGKQRGESVKVRMVLPIVFKIDQSNVEG